MSNKNDDVPTGEEQQIPVHGRKALKELADSTVKDISPKAGGWEVETEDGTFRFQALMDEVTVEFRAGGWDA